MSIATLKKGHLKERDYTIDSIKGFAILLVVWGHSIQFIKKDGLSFFENGMFIIIYSFHMPLFMMISGYLFYYSLYRLSTHTIITKRFLQLIIPSIAWFILESLIIGRNINFSNIKYGAVFPFWFLSALFAISVTYAICHMLNNKFAGVIFTAIFVISLMCGDEWNMDRIKFMAPYFLIGVLSHNFHEIISQKKHYIGITSVCLWIVTLIFWNREFYIYITKMSYHNTDAWGQTYIILYRFIAGFAGCFSVVYLYGFFNKKNNLFFKMTAFLGLYTLPIYIISTLILSRIASHLTINELCTNPFVYNLIISPAFSFFIIGICLLITRILKMSKIASVILLGGK